MDGAIYRLTTGNPNQVYYELFNQVNLLSDPEVMLWRGYTFAFGSNALQTWPNGSGYTQDMVNLYLCTDGLPIGVSPLYRGDKDIRNVVMNRDPRFVQTVMNPGDPITINLKNVCVVRIYDVLKNGLQHLAYLTF